MATEANDFKKILSRGIAALETRLYGHCEEVEKVMAGYNPSSFCAGFLYALTLAKGLLTQMPDAVEVVHGEWLLRRSGRGHYWECSVCQTNPCIYVTKDTNFCPNCGAKMDGDKNV